MPRQPYTPTLRRRMAQARYAVKKAKENGDLQPPESCARCGAVGQVLAHHHDYAKPLEVEWLCRACHAAEHRTTPDWVAAAQTLRSMGRTYDEIAVLLGKTYSIVYKRLNVERAQRYARASNAKRRRAKRANERERTRSLDSLTFHIGASGRKAAQSSRSLRKASV